MISQNVSSALEYIFLSKSNREDSIPIEKFTEILKVIYDGVTYERVIEETMRLAASNISATNTMSTNDNNLRMAKFVALIQVVYMKEKTPYPIAIALIYILEQIRLEHLKDTNSGNYIEAGKAQEQIDNLISSETSRRKNALLLNKRSILTSLQKAHTDQYECYTRG